VNRQLTLRSAGLAAVWAATAGATAALDGRVDLGSQGMPLVLAAAATGLWLPAWAAATACLVATMGFNWFFVPPRGSLQIGMPQHLLLLVAMLGVSAGTAVLVSRQRRLAEREARQAARLHELLDLGARLRTADEPAELQRALSDALAALSAGPVSLLVAVHHERRGEGALVHVGELSEDERVGLRLCMTQAVPFGPGTGRYEHQGCWYLPLRGRSSTVGAALLRPGADAVPDDAARTHAQALCDQVGLAVERGLALQAAREVAQRAQDERLRNTVLAAVSHDYRTPLATILGAASALRDQADRVPAAQRSRLASIIVDEVTQLSRLTDNALQLARLDAPGVQLRLDWESAEELVGSVLARVRQRDPQRRVRARIEPDLPLLRCDAVLIVQLLENLVDNALKHTPADAPVEVLIRRIGAQLLIAVRDRGPGVPPEWRERIFEVFQRVQAPADADAPQRAPDAGRPRGAGVGLAVCRAIAQAHGGALTVRARGHGGASFEFRLPLADAPAAPAEPADHEGPG
jgi:two-component system sensor histidine kinase KdpD